MQHFRSRTVYKNLNPTWNEVFEVRVFLASCDAPSACTFHSGLCWAVKVGPCPFASHVPVEKLWPAMGLEMGRQVCDSCSPYLPGLPSWATLAPYFQPAGKSPYLLSLPELALLEILKSNKNRPSDRQFCPHLSLPCVRGHPFLFVGGVPRQSKGQQPACTPGWDSAASGHKLMDQS